MADLQRLLSPRSIAIVGVSEDPKTIRGRLLQVLLHRGFSGPLYLVSRRLKEVRGRRTFATLEEVPETVDLVILAAPAQAVPQLVEQCGKAGIRAVLVIASGFAEERGDDGRLREIELQAIARRYDMAVCGPNTEGFVNNLEKVAATFCPTLENTAISLDAKVDVSKRIAVISQSGGFAFTFLNISQQRQISYSFMISSGNESCLETADYLHHLLERGGTDVFLLYLEGVRDPAKLRAALHQAAVAGKPVIAAKTGRSQAGRNAAASHTGSMAGEARVFDALFREYGVIEGSDLDQMVDTATAFTYCKLPPGRRVAVISNSGGGAVWLSDMLTAQGFEIVPFDAATRLQIEKLLPTYGVAKNPVDLTATAVREVGYAHIVEIAARCATVDLVIVIGSLAYEYVIEKDRDAFARIRAQTDKPILFCTYTTASARAVELLASAGIPAYTSMPNCVRAARALADYAEFHERWQRDQEQQSARPADITTAMVERVRKQLGSAGAVLTEVSSKQILAGYGLPQCAERMVSSAEEAVAAASDIGFPVAIKAQSPEILHKTEAGAVVLGLKDERALREAYAQMLERVTRGTSRAIDGVLVQKMAAPGLEMTIGITRDAQFGPMIMLGLGGVFVELLDDVALAPAPISRMRARELLQGLRAARMFAGYRGMPSVDLEALADVACRVSWFAHDQQDLVAEIDLNPVIVHAKGLTIVDALIVRTVQGGESRAVCTAAGAIRSVEEPATSAVVR